MQPIFVINATPERVWKILTGINEWSNWQSEISQPTLDGALIPGSTFDWKTGGAKIHSLLHTVEPLASLNGLAKPSVCWQSTT